MYITNNTTVPGKMSVNPPLTSQLDLSRIMAGTHVGQHLIVKSKIHRHKVSLILNPCESFSPGTDYFVACNI